MLRSYREGRSMPGERGFALIAILSLAALVSAFLIASAINLTSAGVSNEREQRSMNALREAKAALIAYAASEQWQLYKALPKTPATYPDEVYFQPGALPCPDQDGDGDADCYGSNVKSMIGRLPFETLGINDLRDASGERLWYALSHDFRKMQCTPPTTGCTTINSDTQGQLTVTGTAPATQVVAIVFAPGEAIQGQDRAPANANNYLNYLEGPPNLSHDTNWFFTSNALPTATFNDRLLVITQAELMAAVEPVVAARIERDVAPLLTEYFGAWGAYPYAVPFAAPPAAPSSYVGSANRTHGLLPVSTSPSPSISWTGATVTELASGGTGSSDVTLSTCSINSPPLRAVCQVDYSHDGPDPSEDRVAIRIDIVLAGANLGFAAVPSPLANTEALSMVKWDGSPVSTNPAPWGDWSQSSPPFLPTRSLTSQVVGGVLSYTGRVPNYQYTGGRVTITIPLPSPPSFLPRLTNPNSTTPNIAWFISNQWYRQTYYAVSPGYAPRGTTDGVAPGSAATCNPLLAMPTTPSCLKVEKLPPQFAALNNKHAILVLVGRDLGANRPSDPTNIANYLEGANLTAANNATPFVYEHRAGVPTAIGNPINDRVVVVAP